MASEIRVNQIQSRTGLSTVTFSDTGIVVGNKISVGSAFIQNNAIGIGTTTTAGRNAGVGTAIGTIIYNETTGQVEIYKRINGWVSVANTSSDTPIAGLTATGGVISDYTDPGPGAVYRAHIFTSSGAFAVSALSSSLPNNVDIFAIGGGGGGSGGFPGYGPGRGGGAGGAFVATLYPVSVNTYPVTIGAGGAGAKTGSVSPPFASGRGSSGGNSTFTNPSPQVLTAAGGGGGGDYDAPSAVAPVSTGGPGGCGGGGGGYPGAPAPNIAGGTATQPSQNPSVSNLTNYGFAGGTGDNTTAGGGGAGGGTGGTGTNYAPPTNTLRAGGPGIPITYAYGPTSPITYGAGGPTGGPNTGPTVDATYSTGNGGMGWLTNPSPSRGANGGSGIIVVRYQIGTSQTGTAKATGGVISYYDGKTIHTFLSSGTFTNTSASTLSAEYVVVAGGGSGGRTYGGGGGAGGYITGTGVSVLPGSPNAITVTVGAGGASIPSNIPQVSGNYGDIGVKGSDSSFGPSLPATGGGYGGAWVAPLASSNTAISNGGPGGSGGGGGSSNTSTTGGPGGSATSGQGFAGSQGRQYLDGGSGGGGGAGGTGQTSFTSPELKGRDGGAGIQLPTTFRNPQFSLGTPNYYVAGGGGGGAGSNTGTYTASSGGIGGGGNGGYAVGGAVSSTLDGQNGLTNTGSGGGGSGGTGNGSNPGTTGSSGAGGSGIVIIAYPS